MHVHEGCLECKSVSNKSKSKKLCDAAYRESNKEKIKKIDKNYYQSNIVKMREKSSLWRINNIEKANQSSRNWRESNPDRYKILLDSWRKRNTDTLKIYHQNRRSKERKGGKLSKGLAERLYKLQVGKCACCKQPLGNDFHLDHIHPIALGGSNTDENIQLLRSKCNLQKGSKHPIVFMQQKGYLL